MTAYGTNSKASYAISIAAALVLARGIESLVRAAAMPLEAPIVRVINFLIDHGWRNVTILYEPPAYPLALITSTAFTGIVLVVVGMLIGNSVRNVGAKVYFAGNKKPSPKQGL
jgi:hypothetical protein